MYGLLALVLDSLVHRLLWRFSWSLGTPSPMFSPDHEAFSFDHILGFIGYGLFTTNQNQTACKKKTVHSPFTLGREKEWTVPGPQASLHYNDVLMACQPI